MMPQEWPANLSVGHATAFLLITFTLIYATAHHAFKTPKQKSYILSTISSGIMSLLSLWFVYTWITGSDAGRMFGFEGVISEAADRVARYGTVFFRSYLIADLLVGSVAYRDQIGVLTGWVHHLAYIAIMFHLDRTHYSGLFMLAAIMEIPTFHLGLSTLWPMRFRHDRVFLVLFFLTRIAFHCYMILSFTVSTSSLTRLPFVSETAGFGKTGRAVVGSRMPGVLLLAAFPMHAMWFIGGIKGHLRRCRLRELATKESVTETAQEAMTFSSDGTAIAAGTESGGRFEAMMMERESDETTDSPESCPAASLTSSSPRETPLLTPFYALSALAGSQEPVDRGYFDEIHELNRKDSGGLGLLIDAEENEL